MITKRHDMLQMCRRPLLMAARVGAQGVCSECFVGQLKQQTLLYNISRVPLLLLMIGSASQVGTAAFSPFSKLRSPPSFLGPVGITACFLERASAACRHMQSQVTATCRVHSYTVEMSECQVGEIALLF